MKVGDLVKFKTGYIGEFNDIGVVIAASPEEVTINWNWEGLVVHSEEWVRLCFESEELEILNESR